jgi:hypothetical protein
MKRSNDTNRFLQVQKYTKVLASLALLTILLASCGLVPQKSFSPNPVHFAETIVIEEDSNSLAAFPATQALQKPSLAPPQLGIDRLHLFVDSLKGKRIAVVANQTSVVNGIHLVDTLLSLNLNVVKVFAPEHGLEAMPMQGSTSDTAPTTKQACRLCLFTAPTKNLPTNNSPISTSSFTTSKT